MNARLTALGVLFAVTLPGIAGAADEGSVFVWTDKDGTPHYQDRPPENDPTAAREMSLRYKLTDSEAIAATDKQASEQRASASQREQEQAKEAATTQAEKDKLLSEREKGCATAKERLEKYDTAHRLYRPGPDGERIYLTDEEIDSARAEARRTVDEWCGE
jgi:hypothetical protein